jgi:NADH-quinone oxidoreductase subunit G
MADTVKIVIDDREYDVPNGMNLVDAAKWYANNDIPVFCYHPKMEPVGMCRMCLVEMGNIEKDRATGEVVLDEAGKPKVRMMPKLQTACTQRVAEGLVVRTSTAQVEEARENVLEFLLTSHPLDCPICDKGGECPLQNLTMNFGPQNSRMNYEDKQRLDKHVPLGDLIYLDEERCIQCARCIRFQEEIVGDAVLAFHERGRRLQIITDSTPGFDSYFSGNTTDICPVGALTTADFRFGARPWELTPVPSIDPFDAAGSNITLSIRLDREFGGRAMIKRVMPRQNEYVNEIWISDKARFGHHFTHSENRLQHPMRRGSSAENSVEVTWNEATVALIEALQNAGGSIGAIAGSMMSNEDLYVLRELLAAYGSDQLGVWPPTHAGADLVASVGVGTGTNLGDLGQGDAVLVIASDLEEEVPIWRLRIKQAHDRGAYVVVANARRTRMDDFADVAVRYDVGYAAHFLANLKTENSELADKLTGANNLIIITGAEGLTYDGSRALMQAAANVLIDSGHVGKPNNGLLSTFPGPNRMGQHYLGYTVENTQAIIQNPPKVLIVAQAELLADDPIVKNWIGQAETVISLSLFPDGVVSQYATLALPVQSFAERDGTYTNGERRVQRFYTAQGPMGEALPAWQLLSRALEKAGKGTVRLSAAAVMLDITKNVPAFAGCTYRELAKVERQFPEIGRHDMYYGGTSYANTSGLGVQIKTAADEGGTVSVGEVTLPDVPTASGRNGQLVVIPTTQLYNRESIFEPSVIMHPRILMPYAELNAADAEQWNIASGDVIEVRAGDVSVRVKAYVNGGTPQGSVLLPRHLTDQPVPLTITTGEVKKV